MIREFNGLQQLKTFRGFKVSLLGLGLYRAWIELVYIKPKVITPAFEIANRDIFDISMVIALLLCAVFARRITPLFKNSQLAVLCFASMTVGVLINIAMYYIEGLPAMLAYAAAIISGIGTALAILYWSERYACMNPFQVVLYYSATILFSAVVIFVLKGFETNYHFAALLLLSPLSLLLLYRSYKMVERENLPKPNWNRYSFPWKLTALMAVYGFALGIQEFRLYEVMGPHSSLGAITTSAVILLGVILFSQRFSVSAIYRFALVLMAVGLLLATVTTSWSEAISSYCISASYSAFWILTMLILSSISYRFGISAVWLFGIERAVRAFFPILGRALSHEVNSGFLVGILSQETLAFMTGVLIVIATVILVSEQELTSKWGISFIGKGAINENALEQHRLAEVCSSLGKEYLLSDREKEVLLLLAQKQNLASIKQELFIAEGTVKSHIRRIYRKLGIHERRELYDILGVGLKDSE